MQNIKSQVCQCIEQMQEAKPHIHCITNDVAQNITANVLLAGGAVPSMTINPVEVRQFVQKADGVNINIGTMNADRIETIETILPMIEKNKKIWTLDPVMVNVSGERLKLAKKLLEHKPSVVRCNRQEAEALFGNNDLVESSKKYGACIVLSGETDQVISDEGVLYIHNGHKWMDKITAMGCALNAFICACVAVEGNQKIGSVAAVAMFGLAGEQAAEKSKGPGTFMPQFIDALYNITAEDIISGAKINEN